MCVTDEIKRFLEENGIKQSYVADGAGIKRDALCTTLNGKRKLPLDEYCRICKVLNVPFEFFLTQTHTEVGA